jgi:hypothetical protein
MRGGLTCGLAASARTEWVDSLTIEATLMSEAPVISKFSQFWPGAGRLQRSWELRGLAPTDEQLIYQCIIRCERGHKFHSERARSLRVLIRGYHDPAPYEFSFVGTTIMPMTGATGAAGR